MTYRERHRHTSELFRLVKYRHIAFVLLSAVFVPLHYHSARGILSLQQSSHIIFNVDSLALIFFLFPSRLFWWYGIAVSLAPFKVDQYKLLLRSRNFGRFILCLVTRGSNVEVSIFINMLHSRHWLTLTFVVVCLSGCVCNAKPQKAP
jgi:hypothetical protein